MASRNDAAFFLASLTPDERNSFSRHSNIALPDDADGIEAALESHAIGGRTIADLFATTGAMAGASNDSGFALRIGLAALEMAETPEERELAHVCLAQTHFRKRKDAEHLASFEEHCEAAIEYGSAGTFCYERLATLYEYRKEYDRAFEVSRSAVEALADERSVGKFRERISRLEKKVRTERPD